MKRVYRLKNGYSITKEEMYNGYDMRTYWCIWQPNGQLYMSCVSYKEAHGLASHLRGGEEV